MATTGSFTIPPRALKHQAAVVDTISSIFSLPATQFEALQNGGGRVLEKLIRSYHYWAAEYGAGGICPYDHRHLGYFRLTPAAANSGNPRALHPEHVVPVRRLVQELVDLRKRHSAVFPSDAATVMAANEIVLVTKHEAKLLNGRYRSSMPPGWTLTKSHVSRLSSALGPTSGPLLGSRLIGP